MEWAIGTGCGAHVGNNSSKWGTFRLLDDPRADLKSYHVVTDSLSCSTDDLMSKLEQFLGTIAFREQSADEEHIRNYWRALGQTPKRVELLVALDIEFIDGTLLHQPGMSGMARFAGAGWCVDLPMHGVRKM